MAIISLSDVGKEYAGDAGAIRVLSGVTLALAPGETAAIVGPSGCGKSTLLNLMGTLDWPTSGSIMIDGKDVSGASEKERAHLRNDKIGFVFQLHHLLPQCSVLENVLVPTLVHDGKGGAVERAKRLLERVGLIDRATHLPGALSGGERQRAAVVRALINKPSLLLADEPTGSLNAHGAEDLTRLLLELNREEGMALAVVTHSEAVAAMLGKVYELREGTLHARGGAHG